LEAIVEEYFDYTKKLTAHWICCAGFVVGCEKHRIVRGAEKCSKVAQREYPKLLKEHLHV
jgi:hypothetical protein